MRHARRTTLVAAATAVIALLAAPAAMSLADANPNRRR